MSKDDWAIVVLWGFAIIVVIVASVVGLATKFETVAKIVVAVIGAAAVIISAILTHALTQVRELQLEQQKQRQANYAELLKQVAAFVRDRSAGRDSIDSAHLYSWVVGSEDVIQATQTFVQTVGDQDLRKLLVAMRCDVGLGPVREGLMPIVFVPRLAPGSITPQPTSR
jgi:cobalamin biosynthesis protein CobD/CbiB